MEAKESQPQESDDNRIQATSEVTGEPELTRNITIADM
jgi:hypothetical protein